MKDKTKVIILGVVVTLLFGGTVASHYALPHKGRLVSKNTPDTQIDVSPEPKPAPKPSAKPTQSTTQPTAVTYTEPVVDENAINAQLCTALIKNAEEESTINSKLYFDSQKDWIKNFAGRYDSKDAIESKNWYKNYTKKLFNDYIASVNSDYKKNCGSGSAADVVVQPDYSQW